MKKNAPRRDAKSCVSGGTDAINRVSTTYKLKKNQPAFDVVDGPMAGRKYTHGVTYSAIPAPDKKKFEPVRTSK